VTTTARSDKPPRNPRGLQTHERLFGAAVAELKRLGLADADTAAIASAGGVAPSTFYFHFPTKEHVLLELEQREEARIARDLQQRFARPHTIAAALTEVVKAIEALQQRLGDRLFRDYLAVHFAASRPVERVWSNHPVIVVVVEELGRSRHEGELSKTVDPINSAVFFLIGLYALFLTLPADETQRATLLQQYVTTTLNGLLPR
jgi:AcrR family transcriptional regulator